jgi:hypothetical protein
VFLLREENEPEGKPLLVPHSIHDQHHQQQSEKGTIYTQEGKESTNSTYICFDGCPTNCMHYY